MGSTRASEITGAMSIRSNASTTQTGAARSRPRDEAQAMVKRESLAAPAIASRILRVDRVAGENIELYGASVHAPGLARAPGKLQAVAVAVCTLGPALERRISALFAARRRLLALALEDIANRMLFRLADRTVATIRRRARQEGMDSGIEASPGDAGLALDQQPTVLALAGANKIAVSVTAHSMLTPVKTLSIMVGLGRDLVSRAAPGRCECCPSRNRCRVK